MGVWIEIKHKIRVKSFQTVTPYVGVWIEICCPAKEKPEGASHPLCGGVD